MSEPHFEDGDVLYADDLNELIDYAADVRDETKGYRDEAEQYKDGAQAPTDGMVADLIGNDESDTYEALKNTFIDVEVYEGASIFKSFESGISYTSAKAVVLTLVGGVKLVTLHAAISGVEFSEGNQATMVCSLVSALYPIEHTPFSVYEANDASVWRINATNGSISVRWASRDRSSSSSQKLVVTYIAKDD